MSAPLHKLREEWLRRAGELMASKIEEACGAPLPAWRVSCGFMASGIRSKNGGECWSPEASQDGTTEIFITPRIAESRIAAAILAHELCHAALVPQGVTGHRGRFAKAAKAIGYAAPVSKFNPTDDLWAWLDPMIAELGPYPHAEMKVERAAGAKKKQAARMIKCECVECGYTVRTARKWIEEKGAPICPADRVPMVCEGVEPAGEDEDREAA